MSIDTLSGTYAVDYVINLLNKGSGEGLDETTVNEIDHLDLVEISMLQQELLLRSNEILGYLLHAPSSITIDPEAEQSAPPKNVHAYSRYLQALHQTIKRLQVIANQQATQEELVPQNELDVLQENGVLRAQVVQLRRVVFGLLRFRIEQDDAGYLILKQMVHQPPITREQLAALLDCSPEEVDQEIERFLFLYSMRRTEDGIDIDEATRLLSAMPKAPLEIALGLKQRPNLPA